jgi:hypothetical protein
MLWMQRIANGFWYVVLALALVGAWRVRSWPAETRVLVPGLLGTWLAIHFAMIGGARFHVPEAPLLALVAGAGLLALLDAVLAKPVE